MNALIVRVNAVLDVRVPHLQSGFLFQLSSLVFDGFSFMYWFS